VSEDKRKSRWLGLVRLLIAVSLLALVLSFVPMRDRLVWEAEFPGTGLVGTLSRERGTDAVVFRSAGTESEGEVVVRLEARDPAAGGWTHVRIESGDRVREWDLDPGERRALAEQPEEGLLTTLKNLRPGPFAVALLLYVSAAVISFVRWYWLLAAVRIRTSLLRTVKLGFFGLFFSNIIPGMTGGDVVKAIYVARDHPGQRAEAVFSVLVDRAIGLFGLALLASVVLLFSLDQFADIALMVNGLLAVMIASSCVLFSRRLRRLVRFDQIVARLPGAELFRKLDRAVLLYRDALSAITVAVLVSLVVHALVLTAIGMIGIALDLPIPSFLETYALAPLPLIIQSVPVAPAGIGVGEWAFVHFWATSTGILSVQGALALALSYRALQLAVSLVGGVLLLFGHERRVTAREIEGPVGGLGGGPETEAPADASRQRPQTGTSA
jgi:uncharacterized protein (TIRG00374 family)